MAEKYSKKPIKRLKRFNVDEEILLTRTLEDHLQPELDIVIIGINPGLASAFHGHHYSGSGNHFWKCLHESGLIDSPMTFKDDGNLLNIGIGFTNIVGRTTRGSADLTRDEIQSGSIVLKEKLQKYRPKIAVFNGKGIYEVFSGRKDFPLGMQSETIDGTIVFVMPSSSPRSSKFPNAESKMKFYMALRKIRDHLRNGGSFHDLNVSEVTFSSQSKDPARNSTRSRQISSKDGDTESDADDATQVRSRFFVNSKNE